MIVTQCELQFCLLALQKVCASRVRLAVATDSVDSSQTTVGINRWHESTGVETRVESTHGIWVDWLTIANLNPESPILKSHVTDCCVAVVVTTKHTHTNTYQPIKESCWKRRTKHQMTTQSVGMREILRMLLQLLPIYCYLYNVVRWAGAS